MMIQPDIKSIIDRFVDTIQGIYVALSDSLPALQTSAAHQKTKLDYFVANNLQLSELDNKKFYRVILQCDGQRDGLQALIDQYRGFFGAKKKFESAKSSSQRLPSSLLLALVSTYDAYLAVLAKSFLHMRPESLGIPTQSCVSAEIGAPGLLNHAQESLVETAIDGLLLKGPDDQVLWLENKLGVDLRADLAASAIFFEVLERRRLYLHHQGIVSLRYLDVCGRRGVSVKNVKAGDHLEITQEYFSAAYDEIYQTGVKLGHLLWRKVIPDQVAKANAALQDLAFNLIQAQQVKLSSTLLSFANTTLLKYADENNRLVFLINGALAAYLLNNKEKCARMLGAEDWSAKPDILKLPHLVLTEQFEEAAKVMRRIGKDGRPTRAEYLRWPLFAEFRKTPEFTAVFNDLFGDVILTQNEVSLLP